MVPWSLATDDGESLDERRLRDALAAFHPAGGGDPGFFASAAYRVMIGPPSAATNASG
jgi:hypothetical protein